MLIDFHSHCYADAIAEKAMKVLIANSKIPAFLNGTAADLSRRVGEAGLDYSLVLPIATKPSQTRKINEWALSLHDTYANLLSFATIHPDNEDPEAEIEWISAHGFKGIKIHPDYQKTMIDDDKFMNIFASMEEHGLYLITHAGFDVGLPPPRHCTPERMSHVLDAFPKLTVIAAHMGGVEEQEEVRKYYNGRNIWLDTCFTHYYLSATELTEAIKRHGADKILFGTDSPWSDQKQQIEYILSLELSDEEKEMILGKNAAGLLKL